MDDASLDRFIAHYQRLTEHQWRDLTQIADAVLTLATDHSITGIQWQEATMAAWYESWLVVTDLDGTLLDHHNYSWQPASSAIELLQQHRVPLVLSSSKTLAEMNVLMILAFVIHLSLKTALRLLGLKTPVYEWRPGHASPRRD